MQTKILLIAWCMFFSLAGYSQASKYVYEKISAIESSQTNIPHIYQIPLTGTAVNDSLIRMLARISVNLAEYQQQGGRAIEITHKSDGSVYCKHGSIEWVFNGTIPICYLTVSEISDPISIMENYYQDLSMLAMLVKNLNLK